MWAAVDSLHDIVWLLLSHRVPLAVAVATTIIVALPIVVIVVAWEVAALLFFFVRPSLHHVA